jgi:hypothetical protein
MLAAMVLARADTNEDYSAGDALSQVLEAITECIGNRKEAWLNALRVIGQRIARRFKFVGVRLLGGEICERSPLRIRPMMITRYLMAGEQDKMHEAHR